MDMHKWRMKVLASVRQSDVFVRFHGERDHALVQVDPVRYNANWYAIDQEVTWCLDTDNVPFRRIVNLITDDGWFVRIEPARQSFRDLFVSALRQHMAHRKSPYTDKWLDSYIEEFEHQDGRAGWRTAFPTGDVLEGLLDFELYKGTGLEGGIRP